MEELHNLYTPKNFKNLNKKNEIIKPDFSSFEKIYEAPQFQNQTAWGQSLLGITVNKLFSWFRRGIAQGIALRTVKKIEDVILNILFETMSEINAENAESEDDAYEAYQEAENIKSDINTFDNETKIYYFNKFDKYLLSSFEKNWSDEYKKEFAEVVDLLYEEIIEPKPKLEEELEKYKGELKTYIKNIDKMEFESKKDDEEEDKEEDEDDKIIKIKLSSFKNAISEFIDLFGDLDETDNKDIEDIKLDFKQNPAIPFIALKTYHMLINFKDKNLIEYDVDYDEVKKLFEENLEKLTVIKGFIRNPNWGYIYNGKEYNSLYNNVSTYFKKKQKEYKNKITTEEDPYTQITEKKSPEEKLKKKAKKKDTEIEQLEDYYGPKKMQLLKSKKDVNQKRLENRINKIFALYLSFLRSAGLDVPNEVRSTSRPPDLGISEKDKQRANSYFEKRLFNMFDEYSDYFKNINKANPKELIKDNSYLSGYNKDGRTKNIESQEINNNVTGVERSNLVGNFKYIFGENSIKSSDKERFIREPGIIKLPSNLGLFVYGLEIINNMCYSYHLIDLIDLTQLLKNKDDPKKSLDIYKKSSCYFNNWDLNVVENVLPSNLIELFRNKLDFSESMRSQNIIYSFIRNKRFTTSHSNIAMGSLFSRIAIGNEDINFEVFYNNKLKPIENINNKVKLKNSISFKKDYITVINTPESIYTNFDISEIKNNYKKIVENKGKILRNIL